MIHGRVALWRRLRQDDGASLVEVLMGSVVTLAVLSAAYMVVMAATQSRVRTTQRVETLNRGRDGMEQITRMLRAQSCYGTEAPIAWAADDAVAVYVADQTDTTTLVFVSWSETPGADRLRDGGAPVGDIVMSRHTPVAGVLPTAAQIRDGSAPAASLRERRTIAHDVSRPPERISNGRPAPIFEYVSLSDANKVAAAETSTGGSGIEQAVPMTTSADGGTFAVPPAQLAQIGAIDVRFSARPRSSRVVRSNAMEFYGRVGMRSASIGAGDGLYCEAG